MAKNFSTRRRKQPPTTRFRPPAARASQWPLRRDGNSHAPGSAERMTRTTAGRRGAGPPIGGRPLAGGKILRLTRRRAKPIPQAEWRDAARGIALVGCSVRAVARRARRRAKVGPLQALPASCTFLAVSAMWPPGRRARQGARPFFRLISTSGNHRENILRISKPGPMLIQPLAVTVDRSGLHPCSPDPIFTPTRRPVTLNHTLFVQYSSHRWIRSPCFFDIVLSFQMTNRECLAALFAAR